jgi:hypothetical protein
MPSNAPSSGSSLDKTRIKSWGDITFRNLCVDVLAVLADGRKSRWNSIWVGLSRAADSNPITAFSGATSVVPGTLASRNSIGGSAERTWPDHGNCQKATGAMAPLNLNRHPILAG